MKRLLPLVLLVCLGIACGSSCPQGTEIVLHAVPQYGQTLTPAGIHVARNIISHRLEKLGVASPSVTIRGNDEIVVDYAGTHALKNLASVIAVGDMQVFDFEKDLASPTVKNGIPTPYPSLYSLLTAAKPVANWGPPQAYAAYYLFGGGPLHPVLQGPAATPQELLAPYRGKQPKGTAILAVPPNEEVVSGPAATANAKPVENSPGGTYWYLFNLPPEIGADDLNKSVISAARDMITGLPEIALGLTPTGAKAFQAITRAEYERGQLVAGLHGSAGRLDPRYAQHNAIVLDGKILATPYIDYTDAALSLGIVGGNVVISNLGSLPAAKHLALLLKSGSLPYRFVQVSASAGCAR